MNGVCYWSGHQVSESEDFVKVLPIVAQGRAQSSSNSFSLSFYYFCPTDQQVIGTDRNGTYNYAYGQSGFSVHMVVKNDQTVRNYFL